MRKTKRILSIVLSIALLFTTFSFVMPMTASAATVYDGSSTTSISIAGLDANNVAALEAGVAGVGGKPADDLVYKITKGIGGTEGRSTIGPTIGYNYENRAFISFDVMFTSTTETIIFGYGGSIEGATGSGQGQFINCTPFTISAAEGIKGSAATFTNAPTSLSANEWHNIAIEVAGDGTTAIAVYVDGVKYEGALNKASFGVRHARINAGGGGGMLYLDNYSASNFAKGAETGYDAAVYNMTDITVAESTKVSYNATEKQFTILDSSLTVAELKALITTDYELTVYAAPDYAAVLADTEPVTQTSVVVAANGYGAYRYYDFLRVNDTIFEYEVNGTGCTITGYKEGMVPEASSALVIPDTVAGYPVVAIGANAFRVGTNYSGVKLSSITMPDTVKTIGAGAFYDTYAPLSEWPASLETIGNDAFVHGGKIPGDFPANLKSIGNSAFQYASLQAPTFPEGLQKIGSDVFTWCGTLTNIVLPDTVTSLGSRAFAACTSITRFRFPRNETFTAIPAAALQSTDNYKTNNDRLLGSMSIYIPETITTIPDGLLRDFKDGASVTIYGANGSAAYDYYVKIAAALKESTYTNLVTYGTEGAYTDADGDGKGELSSISFVEYDFETNSCVDNSGINTGTTAPGLGTQQSTTTVEANVPGLGGKLAEDVVIKLNTMGGTSGQNFWGSAGEGAKAGVFYHEISVMAPSAGSVNVQFGTYRTAEQVDTIVEARDGFYNSNPSIFTVSPSGISVFGTKVESAKAGRWYTIGTVIENGGSSNAAVYVNGVKYDVTLDEPSYGVRHFRVYPASNAETYQVYYDNQRSYRSDTRNYHVLGDTAAEVTSNSDAIGVYEEGIIYADKEAVYTVAELKAMLNIAESARANVRIYSDETYTTELADNENVTDNSIVVVAATNGYNMERVYSYYPINPLINTTIYDYEVIDEAAKTAKVIGFYEKNLKDTDDLSSIAIPSEILGYTITEIGSNAFYGNTEIQSVVIPDTVTVIGGGAFGNDNKDGKALGGISSVKLSKNLKTIGGSAFKCNPITSIEFPDGLESIGNQAFYWTNLTEISLPDSVTNLGSAAFRLCGSAKYIKLSAGITAYTDQFYVNAHPVEDIIIPASVTSIGDLAFTNLETYDISPKVYGVAGTYAEQYANDNGFEFVGVIANTIVAASGIYGDGSKELAGTDYDIKYGYEKLTFKGKLVNIGEDDTNVKIVLALFNENDKMLERTAETVTIPAGGAVSIDETTDISIPVTALTDDYTVKAFIWKASNNEPAAAPVEFTFDADKKEIHVLAIANSFCNDSFGYINDIAEADGVVLKTQNMYIGGAKITQHFKNMNENLPLYQAVINTVYAGADNLITMQEALESDKWDVVALQGATHGRNSNDFAFIDYATWVDDAKDPETGKPKPITGVENITTQEIYEFINTYVDTYAPGAKHIMHMSWGPCEAESKTIYSARFADAEDASQAVFEAQKAAYEYASTIYADEANMMVPTSYAVQYALNTLGYQEHSGEVTGEKYDNPVSGEISIYRDETCHLTTGSAPYGRVLAGLTWYEYLTGNDVTQNPYQNSSIPADVMAKLKEAAHYANQQVVPITGTAAN